MLTDFGLARMTQYTQAFFQTTTRDATAGSVRWTAYELFPLDLQSGSDESSSSEEDLSLNVPSTPFARSTISDQNHISLAVSSASSENRSNPTFTGESEIPEIRIGEEDEDSNASEGRSANSRAGSYASVLGSAGIDGRRGATISLDTPSSTSSNSIGESEPYSGDGLRGFGREEIDCLLGMAGVFALTMPGRDGQDEIIALRLLDTIQVREGSGTSLTPCRICVLGTRSASLAECRRSLKCGRPGSTATS